MSPRAHAIVAGSVALVGFAVYLLTGTAYVETSLSAPWLLSALRIAPFPSMEYPLWSWIARFLAGADTADFARTLNVFSAICGAIAVGLMYRLTESSLRSSEIRSTMPALPMVSGLAAALFLMLSIPIWMVSNRAHPAAFDLVLLLGSLRLLQLYNDSSQKGWLFAFSFVFGLGLAELGTFLVILPFLGIHVLYLLWKKRHLGVGPLLLSIALGLCGASFILFSAWQYYELPAAKWREAQSYWDVLKYFLVDRRLIIMRSLPRHGWLLLGVSTLVPWIMIWAAQRKGRRWEVNTKLLLFCVLLFGIALAILFNTPIAPWRVLGVQPLLVTPYVFAASTFGLLIARAGVLLAAPILRRKRQPRLVTPLLATLVAVPLIFAAIRNAPSVATRPAKDMHALAAAVLDMGNGRSLWVSDGMLEAELSLEAYARKQPFNYVNAAQAGGFTYRRYLSSLFTQDRLQSLAMAGLGPLLSSWLEQDEGVVDRLAVTLRPDIWLSGGLEPVPMGLVYLGAADRAALDPVETWRRNREFWETVDPLLDRLPTNQPSQQLFIAALREGLSHVANDLGVFLEYTQHGNEAAQAYAKSLSYNPENLSAALNLLVIAGEVEPTPDTAQAAALRDRELEKQVPRSPRRIAFRYGHLRSAAAAELIAVAPSVVPTAPADAELQEIHRLFQEGNLAEARRRLERHLAVRSDQVNAWLLLAAIGFREGQPELIERSLRQMKNLNQEWPYVLDLMGRSRQQEGDMAGAREYYTRALAASPADLNLMLRLLDLEVAVQDWFNVEQLLNQILIVWPNNDDANFALATLLKARDRLDLSESILRRQLLATPVSRALAELADVLRLQKKYDEALETAMHAVAAFPKFARTHEVRGLVLMDMGRLPEAGEDLKKAYELAPASVSVALSLMEWHLANKDTAAARELAGEVLRTAKSLTPDQDEALRKVAP
ncbi:MAG: DUF2723 domain-containing protein [Kiritimatiellae bacterium]|nr:DUF2723 domain-containing protein [Kiritimatiellia bacterium]